jgi:hypothetical protein
VEYFSGSTAGTAGTGSSTAPKDAGTYTVRADFAGNGNYNSSSATKTTTISKAQGTLTLAVTPTPVQYSDPVSLQATIAPAIAGNVQFEKSTDGGTSYSSLGSPVTVSTSGVATLPSQIINDAPSTPVRFLAVFTPTDTANYLSSTSNAAPLAVTQEDARAYYTGQSLFFATSTSATTATLTLPATIKDITAVDPTLSAPNPDNYPGNITNAKVTMVITDANTSAVVSTTACSNLTPSLVNSSDTTVGTVVCQPTVPVSPNSGGSIYNVQIKVGGYYLYDTIDGLASITVALPLATNFITGGGYLVDPTSGSLSTGVYAGDPGRKTNFGFNVKYNKSGTNLQGNVNIIVRKGTTVYQFKSNSLSSLSVSYCKASGGVIIGSSCAGAPTSPCTTNASLTCPITATFLGKATLNNATTGQSIAGNLSLQMAMTDWGEPGSTGPGPDTIAITVYNGSNLWFSSQWNTTQTVQKLLDGGNLVAH